MHDVQLVKVLDPGDDLVEEFESLWFLHALVLHDVVEKFSTVSILHDQVELLGRLNDFVELNDVWVSDHLQDVNLSCHPLDVVHILDLILLKYLDGYFLPTRLVSADLDFTECSLTKIST